MLIATPRRSVLAYLTFALAFAGATPAPVRAQSSTAADPSPAVSAGAAAQGGDDDAGALDLAEPDFVVVNLPTTLRLPLHKSSFRLTHRFNGNLETGSFGDQAGNLFGIDTGATIGFEYRFAVLPHVQAAVYRSSFDKTIQLYSKYDAFHQNASVPLSVSALVSVEGPNNFRERYAPALGVVVSRKLQDWFAAYAQPVWVHNSAAAAGGITRDTFYVGLGGRLRIRPTVYLTGEVAPRASGYAPGQMEFGFGIEKRVGGHVFQLTFANTSGTTFGQIARGGSPDTLYLGFNLSRKFF